MGPAGGGGAKAVGSAEAGRAEAGELEPAGEAVNEAAEPPPTLEEVTENETLWPAELAAELVEEAGVVEVGLVPPDGAGGAPTSPRGASMALPSMMMDTTKARLTPRLRRAMGRTISPPSCLKLI